MTRVTSAMPIARRADEPAKITSSERRVRSVRPCSPSVQRSASARFDLPLPLGPTTALMPGPNSTVVRSANDLKPTSRRAVSLARLTGRPRRSPRSRLPVHVGQGVACRLGLSLAPAAPLALSEHAPADQRVDDVVARVRWSFVAHQSILRRAAGLRVRTLLEDALGRLQLVDLARGDQFGRGHLAQPAPRPDKAKLEIDRAADRLEGGGKDALARPLACRGGTQS